MNPKNMMNKMASYMQNQMVNIQGDNMLESKDILKFINGSSVNYQNTIFDELRKGILLSQDVDLTEFDAFLQNSVKKGSVLIVNIVNVTSPSGNQFVQILRTNKSLTSTTLVAEDYVNKIIDVLVSHHAQS